MRVLVSLIAGIVFGLGLYLSGMTDTARVLGFLDVAGGWDPTLAFVMAGAIVPMILAWRVAAGRRRAALGDVFPPVPKEGVDRRLAIGSVLFGVGWGLSGFCPGPALAALGWSGAGGAVFTGGMIMGMVVFHAWNRRSGLAAA